MPPSTATAPAYLGANNPPQAIYGEPGTTYTNDTGKILYQFHCQFANSCARCISYANRIGPWWPIPLHHGCNCTQSPIPPGATGQPFIDYVEEMKALEPHQQARAMGASNWKLVESGAVDWTDVVTRGRIRTFAEVVQRKKLDAGTLKKAGVKRFQIEQALTTKAQVAPAEAAKSAIVDKLKALGVSDEEIKARVAARIKARLGIKGAPGGGGPQKFPPAKPGTGSAKARPARPGPKPAGTPVSDALSLPKGPLRPRIEGAVKAIDSVHGDGNLPSIPIEEFKSRGNLGAQFHWRALNGRAVPSKIEANTESDTVELSVAHEVGHFLDISGAIPGSKLGARTWPTDPMMGEFYRAAGETAAIKELRELSAKKSVPVLTPDGATKEYFVDKRYVAYNLEPAEIWARAYAQYIATRSGDDKMHEQVAKSLVRKAAQVYYPRQWMPDDFEPIAKEIDALFTKLGWRK